MIWSLVVVIILLASGGGKAEEQGFDLGRFFDELRLGQSTLHYRAEQRIYAGSVSKSVLARFQITCAYPLKKRERLDGPPGDRVTFLEDGNHLWTYVPKQGVVIKKPLRYEPTELLPRHFYDDVELIKSNYDIIRKGELPSSDMLCQVFEFVPKYNNRPIREIWFEREKKLPVRIYIYTPEGRYRYSAELDHIEWNPRIDKHTFHLMVPYGTKVYEISEQGNLTLEQAQRLMQVPLLVPPRIPDGFSPLNILVRFDGERRRAHVIYSDGLSSLSIFQETVPTQAQQPDRKDEPSPAGPAPSASVTRSHPCIFHYGLLNVLSYDIRGIRTTLVGDIGENDLLDTARSFLTGK